jgi:hypothetical protein
MLGPTAVVTRSAVMIRAITSCPAELTAATLHHVQLLIRAHHVHLVLLAVVELVDQGLVDVGEGDLMAGVSQQFADEAPTDVAGTKMQCFHDINLYNQRR